MVYSCSLLTRHLPPSSPIRRGLAGGSHPGGWHPPGAVHLSLRRRPDVLQQPGGRLSRHAAAAGGTGGEPWRDGGRIGGVKSSGEKW